MNSKVGSKIAIIFDFNGTMVFDAIYHDEAWKHFSRQLRGYALSDDEIQQHIHGNVNEKIIEYLKPDLSKDENYVYSLEKEAYYRKLCAFDERYQLVKGLPSFLDECLHKNILMTIASASIKENIDFFVSHFKLDRYFEPKNIVYDDGTYKNKVNMILDAAHKLGVSIHDCVIFEDSKSGIACAKMVKPKHLVVVAKKDKQLTYQDDSEISLVIENFTDERMYSIFK